MDKGIRRWLIMAVFIATFMTSVEITIVTTALPAIISSLHGLAYQSWIMSAYLLTTAITTPIYGKLADAMGRKRIFLWGVLLFILGSGLCGVSPSILLLILSRALQGIGAGAVMPLTFTIIADSYSFDERPRVMAFNNTAWGISALVGPLIGGFLVQYLNWHWVFFVNVPLGIIVFFLTLVGYRESAGNRRNLKIDRAGIVWLAAGLISLLLAVQLLDSSQKRLLWISAGLLLAAAGACGLLVRRERHFSDPLIAPSLFARPTFTVQIITALLLSGILIGYQIYFPIWLQSLYRLPATIAGLVVTSSSVMWLLMSFTVGPLITRFAPKKITLCVVTLQMLAYLPLIFAGRQFPSWAFYVIAAISGSGMGIVISMNTILCQHLVGKKQIGSATSLLTLGRTLGQTIMTGIFGALFNFSIRSQLQGIPFSWVNNVISSKNGDSYVARRSFIDGIILNSLHMIFLSAILLFLVVLIVNWRDPNNKIVK